MPKTVEKHHPLGANYEIEANGSKKGCILPPSATKTHRVWSPQHSMPSLLIRVRLLKEEGPDALHRTVFMPLECGLQPHFNGPTRLFNACIRSSDCRCNR